MLYLVDTGVLLRAVDRHCAEHASIMQAFRELRKRRDSLAVSAQSIREFWNVSTRPTTARGGYGRTVERTVRWIKSFERFARILPETPATFARWRAIAQQHQVRGVQVHDANLVAVAEVYGADAILTLNPRDFSRFSAVRSVTPVQVLAQQAP
ncbi:MAG: type II toxin-antitoxin system VapC family toxin [Pirellulales bacterium]